MGGGGFLPSADGDRRRHSVPDDQLRDSVEAAVASLAGWLPVGWAFAAGMVASVNPCGFLMLPTYISYHLGTQEEGYYEQPVAKRGLQGARPWGSWRRPGSWSSWPSVGLSSPPADSG